MANHKVARIIPVALTIIVIAIVIAALVSLTRFVFFSSNNTTTSQTDTTKNALLDMSADSTVRMTIRGRLVADEDFRSYQIQVAPTSRTLTTYKGYLDQPIDSISLGNNTKAYEQFVYALNKANMMKGTEFTGDKNDLRGICSTGYVYEFRILKADTSIKQLWTSSCSGSRGSLIGGNLDQITDLFINQIPNAESITGKLWR